MFAQLNYCGLKRGQEYFPTKEGFDWYLVKSLGKMQHIPKWVLDNTPPRDYNRGEDNERE